MLLEYGQVECLAAKEKYSIMIDKLQVMEVIHQALDGTDKYLVDLKITTDNRIYVFIDGDSGIIIDDCVDLSRQIEGSLDREVEDFKLNVASAGLDSPLKLTRQYKKNVGQTLSVTTMTGEKHEGELMDADDEKIVLHIRAKKKCDDVDMTFAYKDIKTAKIVVKF